MASFLHTLISYKIDFHFHSLLVNIFCLDNSAVYRPGLLGKTKYEFAKTYCAVKVIQGFQGKFYQVLFLVVLEGHYIVP
jgi:hypothetical protein